MRMAKVLRIIVLEYKLSGLPRWLSGKESAWQFRRCRLNPWFRKIPWRRKWQPTPVCLPGKSHGWRRLVGYSPWGHKESDMTAHTHTHTHTHTFQQDKDILKSQTTLILCLFCTIKHHHNLNLTLLILEFFSAIFHRCR